MNENDTGEVAEGNVAIVRYLKALVTGLAIVMGVGVIAIAAILWIRLGEGTLPELPQNITLPNGAAVEALTFAPNWTVVVTKAGQVLLYDKSGTLRQEIQP